MLFALLKLAHVLGAVLIGGGLIGVWLSDLRSRQIRDLPQFSEAVRNIAVFYDGIVVPGAILLLVSGTWLIAQFYNGWVILSLPWLAGMVFLFAFEFIEGNTVTRVYFMKLRRITAGALEAGHITPELEAARHANVPTFTHFLDLPLFLVIVSLGVVRPVMDAVFFWSGNLTYYCGGAFYSRTPDVRMESLAGLHVRSCRAFEAE